MRKKISFIVLGLLILTLSQIDKVLAVNYLASDLLGQLDGSDEPVYTSSTAAAGTDGLDYPTLATIDYIHHRLFVADCFNNRVLVFNLDNNNNLTDRLADNVLGQNNFTSTSSATTQNGLTLPCSVLYDPTQNRLFVGEANNSRITVFDVSSITDGENAVSVLGQADFTSVATSVSQTVLRTPAPAAINASGTLLYVTDGANRIMIFDVATTTNGEAAIGVLGQTNFTSEEATTTDSGLYEPAIGALDEATNRLFITDKKNHRIMIFDVATTTNGEAAIGVLGQNDFVTNSSGTSQTEMSQPQGLAFNSSTNMLYVSDESNRILIFDVATTTNGEAAVNVLGQPTFTSSTASTSQSGFNLPLGMTLDTNNHRLYVADNQNNRIMILDLARITNSSFPDGVTGASYNQVISITNNQGTTTLSIASGSVPTGLSSILTGTPTAAGTFNFTLQATDAFPTGNIIFKKDYSITINTSAPTTTPTVGVPSAPPPPPSGGGSFSLAPSTKQQATKEESDSNESSSSTMKVVAEEEKTITTNQIQVRVLQTKLLGLLQQLLVLLQQLLSQKTAS